MRVSDALPPIAPLPPDLAPCQEWSAGTGDGAVPGAQQPGPAAWVFMGASGERHDAAHLVSHRVVAAPAELATLLAARLAGGSRSPAQQRQQKQQQEEGAQRAPSDYARLLLALDAAAGAQVDASLARLSRLSEMHVARCLAAALPAGHGLFLGNSMPIRDMEMYGAPQAPPAPPMAAPEAAAPPAAAAAAATAPRAPRPARGGSGGGNGAALGGAGDGRLLGSIPLAGAFAPAAAASAAAAAAAAAAVGPAPPTAARVPEARRGAPVGANRGASGIDGVLSTAAGFAQGLARPTTLVVGDLSFLHDINGLNLLRGGEMRPPLTVVLVNNGGGGIFSFLPVAGEVERDTFERLWGTPQNVDLEGAGGGGGVGALGLQGRPCQAPHRRRVSCPLRHLLTRPHAFPPRPQACAARRACRTSA
jgi:isochorismate synthase/2-succinyl-5-enolpyruvyl-6-hydroxy-3-cyclohexene-1-carboxylate synthase/2-succinyl-6-hydroxy-2,4-cyclohexadiene-1-carboxylate synthase/O-succinylbenzoate synthase